MVEFTPNIIARLNAARLSSGSWGRAYDADPRGSFASVLRSYGLRPAAIVLDRIQRIPDELDRGKKRTGWYVYHEVSEDAGVVGIASYGNFRSGEGTQTWYSQGVEPGDRPAYADKIAAMKEAHEAERLELQREAAEAARVIWEKAEPALVHPYLMKKGIKPLGDARVGVDGSLLIPRFVGTELVSYQRILPDGSKRYQSGGRSSGAYLRLLGGIERGVYVCEGYATGCSIAEATGALVYVAFDAGNLYNTVLAARGEQPGVGLTICGDDDHAGREKAEQAATIGARTVYPSGGVNDFNDLHARDGLGAVRRAVELLPAAPKTDIGITISRNERLFTPPGILGVLANYYNATSVCSQPGFAVQTALAIGSVLLGRDFVTDKGNRTTLFFMCLGESGTGKESIKTVPGRVLDALDASDLMMGSGYTSQGAVISALMHRPKHITINDEYAKLLAAAAHKNASPGLQEANAQIMQAFSEINGTARPKNYSLIGVAKEKRTELLNMRVAHPALTMVAIATPEDLFNNLTMTQINDGFINRFLVYTSDVERQKGVLRDTLPVPEAVRDWWLSIKSRVGTGIVDCLIAPTDIVLPFSADAWELQDEFNQECIDYGNGTLKKFGLDRLNMRTNEQSMRMALICALCRDPYAERVERSDVEWSTAWARHCLEDLFRRVKLSVSGSPYEKSKLDFLRVIRAAGEQGVSIAEMAKRKPFSNYKKKERAEILDDLVEAGMIDKSIRRGGVGAPPMTYVAV